MHIFQIGEAHLAAASVPINENISVSPMQIIYAWISFTFAVALIAYVRIIEIYDRPGKGIRSIEFRFRF